jgi:hypothetical protein
VNGRTKAVVGGTAHRRARSFSPKTLAKYEETRAYRDLSLAWVLATRGFLPCEVVDSWDTIQWPMNQFRTCRLTVKQMEVAAAYNLLAAICTDKSTAEDVLQRSYAAHVLKTKWIFTTEEDNIIPPDAVMKLFAALFTCPDCGLEVAAHCAGRKQQCKQCREWRCEKGHKGYDGVSGLYSVKTNPPIPMVFGNPKDPADFRPRSVRAAVKAGTVVEVNGIPMGCAIFRKDLFRKVRRPWFSTGHDHTQDLYFCKKARKYAGARFAVHCGVLVGHLDVNTGEII